jgi:hypothetical protein
MDRWLCDVVRSITEVQDLCTGKISAWIVIEVQVANEAPSIIRHRNAHISPGLSNCDEDIATSVDRAEVVIEIEINHRGIGTLGNDRRKQGRLKKGREELSWIAANHPLISMTAKALQLLSQIRNALISLAKFVIGKDDTRSPVKCSDVPTSYCTRCLRRLTK